MYYQPTPVVTSPYQPTPVVTSPYQPTPVVTSPYQPFLQPLFPLRTQFIPRINDADSVCLEGYTFLKLLGEGGFGKVYLAEDNVFRRPYAIKCTTEKNQQSQSESIEKTLLHEYNLLSKMSHANIVKCYQLFHTGTKWYLVMEFMDMGSVRSVIDRLGPIQEIDVKYITKQVLNGLVFLEKIRIVHRDIKADNLLLNSAGILKIADFGITKRLYPVQEGALGLKTTTGTVTHLAPEILFKNNAFFPNCPIFYGAPVDIWSLGCTVMEMLTGRYPLSTDYFKSIYWGCTYGFLHFDSYRPAHISNPCWSFIRVTICPLQEHRWKPYFLLEHPWQLI